MKHPMMTHKEAARYLGVAEDTLYVWARAHKLRLLQFEVHGRRRYVRQEVEALDRARRARRGGL